MKAAHTPPWKVGKGPNGEVEIWGGMRMNAYPILASMEHEDRDANAALIIAAVNSREALIKAIQMADGCFEAALAEGWLEAVEQGNIEAIRDLWHRRLSFARDQFADALAKAGAA